MQFVHILVERLEDYLAKILRRLHETARREIVMRKTSIGIWRRFYLVMWALLSSLRAVSNGETHPSLDFP